MGYKKPSQDQHTQLRWLNPGDEAAASKPIGEILRLRVPTGNRKSAISGTTRRDAALRMTSLRLRTKLAASRGILGLAGPTEFGALFVPVEDGFADAVHGLLRHQARAL